MRVDHLVIVTFPKQGPKCDYETVKGAEALYKRYTTRVDNRPLSARIVEVWDNAWRRKAPDLGTFAGGTAAGHQVVAGQPINQEVANSDNVGVYIICHGHGNKPVVFGGQGSAMRLDSLSQSDLAAAMAGLLSGLGLTKVRKLCLLKCGTSCNLEQDPNFLLAMANALAEGLASPPQVAAWDDYVSVVSEGEHLGQKLVQNKDTLASANPSINNAHKAVAVWVEGKYKVRPLVDSGWSDKP